MPLRLGGLCWRICDRVVGSSCCRLRRSTARQCLELRSIFRLLLLFLRLRAFLSLCERAQLPPCDDERVSAAATAKSAMIGWIALASSGAKCESVPIA